MSPINVEERLRRPHPAREAAVAAVAAIEGWMAEDELGALYEAAAAAEPGSVIVEVGTYRGRSAVVLALGSRAGAGVPVYTFDPHLSATDACGGSYGPADQAALYATLSAAGVGEEVFSSSIDSKIAAAGWPARNIGLLIVDGDHAAAAVAADFWAWRPHLRDDALVCFDDSQYPPVGQALHELRVAGDIRPLCGVGKLSWWTVPPLGPAPAGSPD